jgi:hypothetical protein
MLHRSFDWTAIREQMAIGAQDDTVRKTVKDPPGRRDLIAISGKKSAAFA